MTQEQGKPGEILLIDKPLGWTSFQAVKKVKWLKKAKKAGHAGTLDPLATGLLVICTERSTKKIAAIQDAPKEYIAQITLGATTPSFDRETEPNEFFPVEHISKELVSNVLNTFIGNIMQRPPLFSAMKVDGKRAYTLARGGSDHELELRPVIIYNIEIIKFESPILEIKVNCGKGTYIRSLAYDIGKALQSGSYLSALRRTKIGELDVDNAFTPQDLEKIILSDNKSGE